MKIDVLVVPNDTLFVGRDGHGTGGLGPSFDGRYIPPSSTFLGAFRSLYLSQHCSEGWDAYGKGCAKCKKHESCAAQSVAGTKTDEPLSIPMHIGPPLLAREVAGRIEPLYPIPDDMLIEPLSKDSIRVQPSYLEPLWGDLIEHDLTGLRILGPSGRNTKATPFAAYLTRKGVRVWAERSVQKAQTLQEEEHYVLPKRLYEIENRVARARLGDAESAEHRSAHIRLRPGVGFLVTIEIPEGQPSLKLPATVAFGGERRTARIETAQVPSPAIEVKPKKRWRISSLAPLSVGAEGLPPWVKPGELETVAPLPTGGKLVALACRSLEHVGGYDMQARAPRPMRTMLPAGTTLFVEYEEPSKIESSTEFLAGGY